MMSALIESTPARSADQPEPANAATAAAAVPATAVQVPPSTPAPPPAAQAAKARTSLNQYLSAVLNWLLPPAMGLGLLVVLWSIAASSSGGSIPTPIDTWKQALEVFSDPFYRNGPNDQGVGWNILASLQRVSVGFGLAALVGIPLGFAIGRFDF
ncbi:MAG: nitrate ABC transporter, permease protein, partial [Comamonas sp.]